MKIFRPQASHNFWFPLIDLEYSFQERYEYIIYLKEFFIYYRQQNHIFDRMRSRNCSTNFVIRVRKYVQTLGSDCLLCISEPLNYQFLPTAEFSLIITKSFIEKNKFDSLKYLGKNYSKTAAILIPRIKPLPVNIYKIINRTVEQLKFAGLWKSPSSKKQRSIFLKQTEVYLRNKS